MLVLVFALCALGVNAGPIRGLNPAVADRYTGEGDKFACLDGSKIIPFKRVNDDYCDCPDGSDEPGDPDLVLMILREESLVPMLRMITKHFDWTHRHIRLQQRKVLLQEQGP